MKTLNAKKDGNGNIIITEESFEYLLSCLDNQKFLHEYPQNGDSLSIDIDCYKAIQDNIQNIIDFYNQECRKILHQKYVFNLESNGYGLLKKYEHQEEMIPWNGNDVDLVYSLFEDKKSWLIQRTIYNDYLYLTISEDGINNRPWKESEVKEINKLFNYKE